MKKKSFQIESFNTWCRVYLEENKCFSNIGNIFSSVTGEKIYSQHFIIFNCANGEDVTTLQSVLHLAYLDTTQVRPILMLVSRYKYF